MTQDEAKELFESDRFQAKFIPEPNSGCWLWTGACSVFGHGMTSLGRERPYAHIVSYVAHHGEIPKGKELHHFRCETPSCINPDHVEPLTRLEHIHRSVNVGSINSKITHCARCGREYAGDNLRIDEKGRRRCRVCDNEKSMRYLRRKAQQNQ